MDGQKQEARAFQLPDNVGEERGRNAVVRGEARGIVMEAAYVRNFVVTPAWVSTNPVPGVSDIRTSVIRRNLPHSLVLNAQVWRLLSFPKQNGVWWNIIS